MFFRMYLQQKDHTDFTGQEQYVFNLIQEQKISFCPIKKAIVIEGRNKQKKDIVGLFTKIEGVEKQSRRHQRHLDQAGNSIGSLSSDVGEIKTQLSAMIVALQSTKHKTPSKRSSPGAGGAGGISFNLEGDPDEELVYQDH